MGFSMGTGDVIGCHQEGGILCYLSKSVPRFLLCRKTTIYLPQSIFIPFKNPQIPRFQGSRRIREGKNPQETIRYRTRDAQGPPSSRRKHPVRDDQSVGVSGGDCAQRYEFHQEFPGKHQRGGEDGLSARRRGIIGDGVVGYIMLQCVAVLWKRRGIYWIWGGGFVEFCFNSFSFC